MTEEQKLEVKEQCKCGCICHNEFFQRTVAVAIGSFVGVFCAISLFAALHKPPMPCPMKQMHPQMRPPIEYRGHYNQYRGPHHGEFKKDRYEKWEKIKKDKDFKKEKKEIDD